MQGVNQESAFVARGYLALSPKQLQDAGMPQGRQWIASNALAEARLTIEQSSLLLLVSVKDTVYIRITIAEKGPTGTLQHFGQPQPKILTPQQTCSCWCLASIGTNVRVGPAPLCVVLEHRIAHEHHTDTFQGSWCFRFQRSEDVQQLTDSLHQLRKDLCGMDPLPHPDCAKKISSISAGDTNVQAGAAQSHSCGGIKSSDQLRSILQDVLRDPDLPGKLCVGTAVWCSRIAHSSNVNMMAGLLCRVMSKKSCTQ